MLSLPLYFFTVLDCVICGMLFSIIAPYEVFEKKMVKFPSLQFVNSFPFLVILSCTTLFLSIAKIFFPIKNASGMSIYFFGDLFPTLILFISFCLLAFRAMSIQEEQNKIPPFFINLFRFDALFGYVNFVIAFLHLFFSGVILL